MGMVVNPSRFGAAPATDPYFSSVVGLWHFDEANGATTFADSSGKGHTLTRTGNPVASNAQAKFGSTSLYINGTTTAGSNILTSDSSTDFSLSGDFTIECWVRPASQSDNYMGFFSRTGADNTSGGLQMLRYQPDQTFRGTLHDGSFKDMPSGVNAAALNTWVHVAMDRSGSTARLYVNGSPTASVTSSATFLGGQFEIGRAHTASDNQDWNGYLQDLRITKGVARYAGSSFSVPTALYPNS